MIVYTVNKFSNLMTSVDWVLIFNISKSSVKEFDQNLLWSCDWVSFDSKFDFYKNNYAKTRTSRPCLRHSNS